MNRLLGGRLEARDSDVDLVARMALGDEDAMRALYERHKVMVGRLARGSAASDADARELVQDTFVRAWRAAASFRGEASVASWLRGILRHLLADHVDTQIRTRKVFAPTAAAEDDQAAVPSPDPGPERLLELAQARRCIDECLRKLSAVHREVLVLRVCGAEMKEQEVAHLLAVPAGTVKSRTSMALRALAACVEVCAGRTLG